MIFFFQAEDGIRDLVRSRGLGDVYKRQYLYRLYLDNELSTNRFPVGGKLIRLSDIGVPMFVVGTEADHVAPWKSVYKVDNPVSYTHLRAHETVLDLVCRLLLEKKKNEIQQLTHDISYPHTQVIK